MVITLGHAAALKQSTAKYPSRRVECKVLSIPVGFSSFTPDNLFLGRIPMRLVCVMVDTEADNETYGSKPYNFKHHNLTQVGVYVDGEQIPRKPLFLKFSEAGGQNFIAGFQSLFSGTGKLSQDAGNQINRGWCGWHDKTPLTMQLQNFISKLLHVSNTKYESPCSTILRNLNVP